MNESVVFAVTALCGPEGIKKTDTIKFIQKAKKNPRVKTAISLKPVDGAKVKDVREEAKKLGFDLACVQPRGIARADSHDRFNTKIRSKYPKTPIHQFDDDKDPQHPPLARTCKGLEQAIKYRKHSKIELKNLQDRLVIVREMETFLRSHKKVEGYPRWDPNFTGLTVSIPAPLLPGLLTEVLYPRFENDGIGAFSFAKMLESHPDRMSLGPLVDGTKHMGGNYGFMSMTASMFSLGMPGGRSLEDTWNWLMQRRKGILMGQFLDLIFPFATVTEDHLLYMKEKDLLLVIDDYLRIYNAIDEEERTAIPLRNIRLSMKIIHNFRGDKEKILNFLNLNRRKRIPRG